VHLESVTDAVVVSVRQLSAVKNVKVSDNKLILDIDNPEQDNPDVVKSIVQAGGNIQYVTELRSTLEDVYLKLIREASPK
jgi:ABC-2 type transport system ATP-binding protein